MWLAKIRLSSVLLAVCNITKLKTQPGTLPGGPIAHFPTMPRCIPITPSRIQW
jgi:hypothetical protein